eukprot:4724225-Pyramimonas_sp.AAC.2
MDARDSCAYPHRMFPSRLSEASLVGCLGLRSAPPLPSPCQRSLATLPLVSCLTSLLQQWAAAPQQVHSTTTLTTQPPAH